MLFGYYICSVSESQTVGVYKKIVSQTKKLSSEIGHCELVNLHFFHSNFSFIKKGFFYLWYYFIKQIDQLKYIEKQKFDFLYIRRYGTFSPNVIKFLKRCKQNNPNAKIILEIPTYPYDKELFGIFGKMLSWIDRFYRSRLSEYVDRIVTFSSHCEIFNIKAIPIVNGIDCESINIRNISLSNEYINLIVVAQFAKWHGVDRLIRGLENYYKSKSCKKVMLHLVGNGPELEKYKTIVQNSFVLKDSVIFYGEKSGEELDYLFDLCDLGICSLGLHRIGLVSASPLKSREYMARGIPFVASATIDSVPADYKYCFYVPADESDINIDDVVSFYDRCYSTSSKKNVIQEMRDYAESKCDLSVTMKPVFDYLKNTHN